MSLRARRPWMAVVVVTTIAAWPSAARAQFVDRTVVVDDDGGDGDATTSAAADPTASPPAGDQAHDLEVRLTLSSFVHRELGSDGPPLVAGGDAPDDASPVRRFFGDARLELRADRVGGGSLRFDGRIRETTSERYQAGAGAGAEYELRAAFYRRALGGSELRVGRLVVDAVGATRLDGVAVERRLAAAWSATLFGGAYPQRGSRSITTDYAAIREAGAATGAPLVPIVGGGGLSYRRPSLYGDLGVGGIHVLQDVPGAAGVAASRVFTSASGYWRPAPWIDAYHYGVLEVAGAGDVRLTNGSLGVDGFPVPALKLALTAHHVDTELLEISARNVLEDPDPAAMGVVQNDAAVVRVSQDLARAGVSLALAQARFELSASGGLHRRPAIDVPLADGGVVAFPAASMAEATLAVLDRRSFAGLRVALSGSALGPIGDQAPSRSRGVAARLVVSRAGERGDVELDLVAQRFSDLGPRTGCTTLDPLACHGTARSTAAQVGGLLTLRAGSEWLLLIDGHLGVRDAESSTVGAMVEWPRVVSVSGFARLSWRYR